MCLLEKYKSCIWAYMFKNKLYVNETTSLAAVLAIVAVGKKCCHNHSKTSARPIHYCQGHPFHLFIWLSTRWWSGLHEIQVHWKSTFIACWKPIGNFLWKNLSKCSWETTPSGNLKRYHQMGHWWTKWISSPVCINKYNMYIPYICNDSSWLLEQMFALMIPFHEVCTGFLSCHN